MTIDADLRNSTKPANQAFVYLAAAFAALGGLLFGYDTGVISGAELFFRNEFTLSTFALEVIVSGVLAGAAVGALIGGRLADLFGRRKLLITTAVIFAAGAILCALATSPLMLVVGRIIVGFGIGLSSSGVPVYISEVAPADARGWQVSLFQLAITVGILLAYLVDYAFAGIQGWRWMFGLAVIPAAILVRACFSYRRARVGYCSVANAKPPLQCWRAFEGHRTSMRNYGKLNSPSQKRRRAAVFQIYSHGPFDPRSSWGLGWRSSSK